MKATFYKLAFSLLILVITQGCKNIEARKPISQSTSSTTKASIESNRKLYAQEEKQIEKVIASQSQKYERSAHGFYYSFINRIDSLTQKPRFGDQVTFEYDVVSLKGDTIYYKDELSPLTKSMEQEYGIFRGMREALKLMKTGESMDIYFPSYAAYGYYGDQDRIGTNVPFKSRVKLLGINMSSRSVDSTLLRKQKNNKQSYKQQS